MQPRYVLGVDGGNSKADFLLCTVEGAYVDLQRSPTVSHEQMRDGFAGAKNALAQYAGAFLSRHGLQPSDLAAAAFGLAGADFPQQVDALRADILDLGFPAHSVVGNDAVLGIKALSPNGVGLCAVNGTGTVVVGIDPCGSQLQIGGIGPYSSDHAGGAHVATRTVSAVYDALLKCGEPTALADRLCTLLQVPDALQFGAVVATPGLVRSRMTDIIRLTDEAALAGDAVARRILDTMGRELGGGIAGCIARLTFHSTVSVVLAGSLWYKLRYPGMMQAVRDKVAAHCALPVDYLLHEAPPAIGGVVWAVETMAEGGLSPDRKRELLAFLTAAKYEEIIATR